MYYTRNYIRLNIFEIIVVSVYPFCEKGLVLISVKPTTADTLLKKIVRGRVYLLKLQECHRVGNTFL